MMDTKLSIHAKGGCGPAGSAQDRAYDGRRALVPAAGMALFELVVPAVLKSKLGGSRQDILDPRDG